MPQLYPAPMFHDSRGNLFIKEASGAFRPVLQSEVDPSVFDGIDLSEITAGFSDLLADKADDADLLGFRSTSVESSSFTAESETMHVVTATATATDFTSPVEGKGYSVLVWNGTATVGGVDYSTKGTIIERRYHSGSWTQKVYNDTDSIGSEAGQALINQPDKQHMQDYLNVPLPYAAFPHTLDLNTWRKAAKFTSTKTTAISATVKTTTGYCRILNFDGTLEAVDGAGIPGSNIAVASKTPTSPYNTLLPKFYAIYPCDASGNLSGDLTYLYLTADQLTSFDGTGLSALTYLYLSNNQLTSFDGTGLSSLVDLHLSNNQLTSFDGTGLSSLTNLRLNDNQLTSFDGTGLSSLIILHLYNNQLTSFDGTGLSSLVDLYIYENPDLTTLLLGDSHTYLEYIDAGKLPTLQSISIPNGSFSDSLNYFEMDFCNLSGSTIDNILIALAASNVGACEIYLSDNAGTRTSASDAAVTALTSGGATISL